jgi:hypothetical protein
MNGAHDDWWDCGHWSNCAAHNEPACPAGPCDGGGYARGGLIGDGAPGLALIHAGDQYISRAQFDLTAILPAPIPAADHARLVQQMARAFGVPLTVVDPHRMCAELELRATEPRTLPPSRLALCAELGRDQRWPVSGHRLLAGQSRGRSRYSSP